jgi:hypothetical protein
LYHHEAAGTTSTIIYSIRIGIYDWNTSDPTLVNGETSGSPPYGVFSKFTLIAEELEA